MNIRVFQSKHNHPVFFSRIVIKEQTIHLVLYCSVCNKHFVEKLEGVCK